MKDNIIKPEKAGEDEYQGLYIRLSTVDKKKLDFIVSRTGRNQSDFVRRAIHEKWLELSRQGELFEGE